MKQRLSFGLTLVFPAWGIALAVLVLGAALPARAQDGATHAACEAFECMNEDGQNCTSFWISLPASITRDGPIPVEDLPELIPDLVRVSKRFPRNEDECDKITWDVAAGTCTGEPAGCAAPEPDAGECASECFCVHPGEGLEIERSSGRPWNIFGEDGAVDVELTRPDTMYVVAAPYGAAGRQGAQLYFAFRGLDGNDCRPDRVAIMNCNGTLTAWSPYGFANFRLRAGEAFAVFTTDCPLRGHVSVGPTHVPEACRGSNAYRISGSGDGSGYGWAVDSDYALPYTDLQDAELENPFAPGAGPAADAAAEARALATDIEDQGAEDVGAQVDRSLPDLDGVCLLGRPRHPVLWISPPGMPPAEGCDVNDGGPCDLEGAQIELAPFPAPFVWLDQERVHWTDVADVYDVVYGRLAPLRESGGDFGQATESCLAGDTTDLEVEHDPLEADPGVDGLWFLVRARNAWNVGFYDQGAETGLAASRDPGIMNSGADCP